MILAARCQVPCAALGTVVIVVLVVGVAWCYAIEIVISLQTRDGSSLQRSGDLDP